MLKYSFKSLFLPFKVALRKYSDKNNTQNTQDGRLFWGCQDFSACVRATYRTCESCKHFSVNMACVTTSGVFTCGHPKGANDPTKKIYIAPQVTPLQPRAATFWYFALFGHFADALSSLPCTLVAPQKLKHRTSWTYALVPSGRATV